MNGTEASLDSIKSDIISSKKNNDDFIVIAKPAKGADVQLMLSVISNLKSSDIDNVTLGVIKDDSDQNDAYDKSKKPVKLPLLKKL